MILLFPFLFKISKEKKCRHNICPKKTKSPQYLDTQKKFEKNQKRGLTRGGNFGIISGHSARGKYEKRAFKNDFGKSEKSLKKVLDKHGRVMYNKLPRTSEKLSERRTLKIKQR